MSTNPIVGLAVALDATEAQIQFALMAGRFEDYRPVLGGSVLATLREMEKLQFATEGSVFGDAWPGLAPSTIRQRERAGYGGANPIMIRTSRLLQSLSQRSTVDSIVKVDRFSMLFGTKVPYADFHQQTTGPGTGHIPERQIIPDPLPNEVLSQIRENVRNYLIEGRIS